MPSPLEGALGVQAARELILHMTRITVAANDTVFVEGQPSESLWFIEAGEVVVTVGQGSSTVEIVRRGPGAWLGEVGFLDFGPATTTVSAVTRVSALCLECASLSRLGREAPHATTVLVEALNRELAERLVQGSTAALEAGIGRRRVVKKDAPPGWWSRSLAKLLGSGT